MKLPKGYVLPPDATVRGINLDMIREATGGSVGLPAAADPAPVLAPVPEEARAGRYTIVLDDWTPPTLNRLMRGKISTRIALARREDMAVGVACAFARVAPATCRRRVSLFVVCKPGRAFMDVDAPWKGLCDSLARCRAIVDDSHRWCVLGAFDVARGDRDRTTIVLEDVPAVAASDPIWGA